MLLVQLLVLHIQPLVLHVQLLVLLVQPLVLHIQLLVFPGLASLPFLVEHPCWLYCRAEPPTSGPSTSSMGGPQRVSQSGRRRPPRTLREHREAGPVIRGAQSLPPERMGKRRL